RGPVTNRSRMVFFAQWSHDFRQRQLRIDLMNQLLDRLFTLDIAAFPKMAIAQVAVFIEKIFCRPVTVGESFPDFAIAVDHNWIRQGELANATLHIGFVLREGELRRVDADYSQSLVAIAFMPGLHIRK